MICVSKPLFFGKMLSSFDVLRNSKGKLLTLQSSYKQLIHWRAWDIQTCAFAFGIVCSGVWNTNTKTQSHLLIYSWKLLHLLKIV